VTRCRRGEKLAAHCGSVAKSYSFSSDIDIKLILLPERHNTHDAMWTNVGYNHTDEMVKAFRVRKREYCRVARRFVVQTESDCYPRWTNLVSQAKSATYKLGN
jgi:hypothetical protein